MAKPLAIPKRYRDQLSKNAPAIMILIPLKHCFFTASESVNDVMKNLYSRHKINTTIDSIIVAITSEIR